MRPMTRLLLVTLTAYCSVTVLHATWTEVPGVMEFSGRILVKPRSSNALRQAGHDPTAVHAQLSRRAIKHNQLTDEYVITCTDDLNELELLQSSGMFEYVEPDWLVYPIDVPNDALISDSWHWEQIQAPHAWSLQTSYSNIMVSVVDTGVDPDHPDLQAQLLPGYNAAQLLTVAEGGDLDDLTGHGTKTTGLVAAIGNNMIGTTGAMWQATVLPVRATNLASGNAYMSDINDGALWACQHGAKIVSVSYGGAQSYSVEERGELLRSMGCLYVWGVGNDGYDFADLVDPEHVIVVGATDYDDARCSFSNYGDIIDVVAPGIAILTTKRDATWGLAGGTSMSTPIVAGVLAAIWSCDPTLTADEVEQILYESADDLGEEQYYGHGRVNLYRAVLAAMDLEHPCPWDVAGLYGPAPDGTVGVEDFFALLQNWGPCPVAPEECPWDCAPDNGDGTYGDGEVDVGDFFALLQHWGVCDDRQSK
jgi:subtilisin family serine protease